MGPGSISGTVEVSVVGRPDRSNVLLGAKNLKHLSPNSAVLLHDLKGRPELNGKIVFISATGWVPAKGG